MDVDEAHAVAPGARILVVKGRAARDPTRAPCNQLQAVDAARHRKGVDVISMSCGYAENMNEVTRRTYVTTPAGPFVPAHEVSDG
jgi:hypothetical protein